MEIHDAIWAALPEDAQPEHLGLRRGFLLDHVPAGADVLDVGCGAGELSASLLKAGMRPVAVDIAAEALRRATLRLPELDARLWEPGEPLPLEDASVDVVWAGDVIEHVVDPAPWLSELRRVLRPRGTLLVTTPHVGPGALVRAAVSRRAFAERFEPRSDHVRFFSRATLRALLGDLGFTVEQMRVRRGTILVRALRGR